MATKRASGAEKSAQANQGQAQVQDSGSGSFDGSSDGSMDGALASVSSKVRRKFNSGTVILGAVIVASGASLWTMRAIDRAAASGPKSSKEIEELVKNALDPKSELGTADDKPDTFITKTQPPTDLQVPADKIQKNPFVVYQDPRPPEPPKPDEPIADPVKEWQVAVDAAAAAIRLQSTLSSSNEKGAVGIANINGNMLRIGEIFGVAESDIEFTIESVERDSITVRAYNAALKHERLVTVPVMKKP